MIAILIAVQIIAGQPAPEISLVPGGAYSVADCEKMAKIRGEGPPLQNDSQGRVVMTREYKCVLITEMDVNDMAELVKKNPL